MLHYLAVTLTQKKIYCIDHSFVTSISPGILVNSGHLLENLVFVFLRQLSSSIYYYKTKNSREVDFLLQLPDRSRRLVQVCETVVNEQTKNANWQRYLRLWKN